MIIDFKGNMKGAMNKITTFLRFLVMVPGNVYS